jgi:Lon protease-like protein
MRQIGLFPLEELVLLPGERVPMHVFEERYKELVGECLRDERAFGVILAHDRHLRSIGTYAVVGEVIDRFDDGRLNVVIEGLGRFEVRNLTEGRSFMTAEVDPVSDEAAEPDGALIARARSLFARVSAVSDREPLAHDPPGFGLSFELGARLGLDRELKQELLELRLEEARLSRLVAVLEARL